MNTIALFGGTFNPPHKGHLTIAQNVIKQHLANEVIFIPAARAPHKLEKPMAPASQRYAMIEKMIARKENLSVSNYEIVNKRQASYTYYTLQVFKATFPNDNLTFIVGADNILNFNQWYKASEILSNFTPLIFQRGTKNTVAFTQLRDLFGNRIAKRLEKNIISFDYDISSTQIRNLLEKKTDVSNLLTPSVYQHIKDNNLYE